MAKTQAPRGVTPQQAPVSSVPRSLVPAASGPQLALVGAATPPAATEEAPPVDGRARRTPGLRMRSQLLDVAVGLFKRQGLAATSVQQIAQAAGAFPSQVTYYFRSKEALFVEAACREVLYAARQTEAAAARCRSPDTYLAALAQAAVQSEGLALYIEALALARRRQDLAPLIARTTERLHAEGARAYAQMRERRRWPLHDDPQLRARRFWAVVMGVVLRGAAAGASPSEAATEVLALLRSDTPG